jgi:cold shock CspA family protein
MSVETLTGTVRTLKREKCYGFIHALDGHEYFFHRSDADDFDDLEPGDLVRFLPTQGPKGPRAEQVERL